MKRVFLSLLVFLMGGLMTVQVVEAQNRRSGSTPSQSSASRPGRGDHNSTGNSRPGSGTASRPGSGTTNNNGISRPGSSGQTGVRPGTNHSKPDNGYRPGNNQGHNNGNHNVVPAKPGNNRPGNSSPGMNVRPNTGPAYRPVTPPRPTRPGAIHRPPVLAPPVRPGRPVVPVWTRPVPPANWRPVYRYNVVPGILGLSFGVNISSALDHFYSSGYSVDGYGTQEVYLRNVNELGYSWDDATLYFNSGGLVRSQFFESTVSYYPTRFNNLFSRLSGQYGNPVNYSNNGSQLSATWFGYNGDYVTLQYTLMNTGNGYRYFTILTYGN